MDIDLIASALEQTGYIVLNDALPVPLLTALRARCEADDRFRASHIGRGQAKQHVTTIRGDSIAWLDEEDATDRAFLTEMDTLRRELNARLFLGLFDYESHYAIYRPGAGYARHSDVLQGKRNRVLTTVLYLNDAWDAENGGELLIYAEQGETPLATVWPKFGKLVIFLSEGFPHEVRPAHKTRRSIAGWFRVSGS